MTDSVALELKIKESGLKKYFIAEKMGLDSISLTNKIRNKSEFKASEIDKLCEILKIESLEEKQAIFFAR